MSEVDIPEQIAQGLTQLIRMTCNSNNNYLWCSKITIGDYNYKITITLQDVDPVKEARISTIIIVRED
jgi:hypothetical protein